MTDTPQSSGERHIEKIMEQLEPDSDRYQVLDTAKRFKSSWVELGDKLLQVSSRGIGLTKKSRDPISCDISATRLSLGDPIGFPPHPRGWLSIIVYHQPFSCRFRHRRNPA